MIKNKRFEDVLKQRMIPMPRNVKFNEGACVIADGIPVELKTAEADDSFVEAVEEMFGEFWNAVPVIKASVAAAAAKFGEEQYKLEVTPKKIVITSHCFGGIDYAMKTLRQLAEAGRGTMTTENYVVQPCVIEDSPAMDFRAIHLCIFPETPMWFIEKQIRLAAYHKFNYAIIESWGVFPFKSHPEFGWKNQMKSAAEFRGILDAADECGITLIPQFNVFGHATMSRCGTGKHATLDFRREFEPIFEPTGWSFCLSNPETRRVLTDLVTELYEFFECPPFFHIGCDEAYDFHSCRECVEHDPVELLNNHITYFRDLFAQTGTRIIMWHDMLFDSADSRWKDCIVCGNKESAGLMKVLPKDIVIADWQYGRAPKDNKNEEWPTSLFLQKNGFDVAVCPWMDADGTRQLGKMAADHAMFGMIETTWHTNFSHQLELMFINAADAAWCGGFKRDLYPRLDLATHLRQIGWDMDLQEYEQTGHTPLQIPREFTQG